MTMYNAEFLPDADIKMRRDALHVTETHWGYTFACGSGPETEASLRGGMMRFLGMCMVMAAIGMWALPGAIAQSDVLGFKLLVCVLLAGIGVILLTRGGDMGRHEVQIDRNCREIRQVLRMKTEAETLLARHCFDEVGSVMTQVHDDGSAAVYLRMKDQAAVIELSSGGASAIRKLALRVSADLGNLALRELPQRASQDVPVKASMPRASVRP
ncbi:hypothetical protein [Pseudogemmobacter sp. W21_MBD1_M6]|uniref:hypothetical protein n=1 Tax=Pseudogemmobacter sp. W21_MBD1_M6 TaxID=3240271 RepID=UPI003F9CC0D2